MQFSTVVLALAATASAAVLPRQSPGGQWFAQLTNGPSPAGLYLTATFTSDDFSGDNALRNACVDSPNNVPLPAPHRCDRKEFDFSYDGAVLNLTQNLPNGVTVFGSVPFVLDTDLGDGRTSHSGVVPVSSAIA